MLCHGNGDNADGFSGGCCWVAGAVCVNRWYIDDSGRVLDAAGVDLGSVDDVARSFVGNSPQKRQQVAEAVQGVRYVCRAAVLGLDDDPNGLTDRAAFDAAWLARVEQTPEVGDHWQSIGKGRDWCVTFGPGEGQCCYGEDQVTNDAARSGLSITAVEVRRKATGAS